MKELLKITAATYNDLLHVQSLSVKHEEIIGLIGKNGAGKSTLLQLLTGKLQWTTGHVQTLKSATFTLVEQEVESYNTARFQTLSGGEKLIARLTAGFLTDAPILLLDEPTNHLDEANMEWLRQRMQSYNGAIVVVSHDRAFLDEVTTKIWAIEDGKLIEQVGNYSYYMDVRAQRRRTQTHAYDKQQQKIAAIEKDIAQLTSWSSKAHKNSTKKEGFKEYYRLAAKRMDKQVKSKRRQLEKQLEKNKIEKVADEYVVQFQLANSKKRGKRLLQLQHVSKVFGARQLFKSINTTMQFGKKIALVGPNGSGKSTLLKMLLGEESYEGDIWRSPSLQIGYLSQSVFDLPLKQSPAQYYYSATFDERGIMQNVMKHLGFSVEQWHQPFASMSMGERVKCKLMQFIVEGRELLLLDEPTNHLDLPSREQLEETLRQYNGSLIVVSHDRYFVEKVTTKTWQVQDGHIVVPQQTAKIDKRALQLMQLENEKQEILGKLSCTLNDEAYAQLDARFIAIVQQIKHLQ